MPHSGNWRGDGSPAAVGARLRRTRRAACFKGTCRGLVRAPWQGFVSRVHVDARDSAVGKAQGEFAVVLSASIGTLNLRFTLVPTSP